MTWADQLWNNLSGGNPQIIQRTINYLAFLAGISCRLVVKDPKTVDKHLISKASDRFFSIFGYNPQVSMTMPPNSKCYSTRVQNMRKMSPGANRVLTILITAKIYAPEMMKTSVEGLLRAMCLLSLSYVGLGTLNWAYRAADAVHMTIAEFLPKMCFGVYRSTAHILIEFISDNKQVTNMYSRLFQDGAFIQLSTKNNPDFAMACAAISLNATEEHEIWSSGQFSNYKGKTVKIACNFALIFRKAIQEQRLSDVKKQTVLPQKR